MNIYLLTQSENRDWDTYDSMVVIAENEEDAKALSFVHTGMYEERRLETKPIWRDYYASEFNMGSWSSNPTVELLSNNAIVDEGVICASFNAG